MLEKLLKLEEGKTLKFKENATSLDPIICSIIAFANTAGGILIAMSDMVRIGCCRVRNK
jgi:ATP-dependent DNA helicase RecG